MKKNVCTICGRINGDIVAEVCDSCSGKMKIMSITLFACDCKHAVVIPQGIWGYTDGISCAVCGGIPVTGESPAKFDIEEM